VDTGLQQYAVIIPEQFEGPPRVFSSPRIDLLALMGTMAVLMALLAFALHSYSPISPAGPKISASPGEGDMPPRPQSRSIERYPNLRVRPPSSARTL